MQISLWRHVFAFSVVCAETDQDLVFSCKGAETEFDPLEMHIVHIFINTAKHKKYTGTCF